MKLETISSWSEIVSSIAVLVTLVFLTIGVRQNTSALQAQSRQAVLSSAQSELRVMFEHPEVGVYMATTGPIESAEDHVRLNAWFTDIFRSREFAWLPGGVTRRSTPTLGFTVLLASPVGGN